MYVSYSDYLKEKFGGKTYKITLGSGTTCPTRDGTISKGGCAFCDTRGSGSFFAHKRRGQSIHEQIEATIPDIQARFRAEHFLAYFQSYTSTYGDRKRLQERYQEAAHHPLISALCVGTRPDCLDEEWLDFFESLPKPVIMELGVQSLHDPTLLWLKRGHSAACSLDCIQSIKRRSLDVGVHLMFGAPTEPQGLPAETASMLSDYKVSSVKLHQLMILKHTELETRFLTTPFSTLSLEDYGDQLCSFLEHLDPKIAIERLYAIAPEPEECLAPKWSTERWQTHNELHRLLTMRGVQQGARRKENHIEIRPLATVQPDRKVRTTLQAPSSMRS